MSWCASNSAAAAGQRLKATAPHRAAGCSRSAAAAGCRQQQRQRQQRRQQRRRTSCQSSAASADAAQLLDQFWLAQGVVDDQQRRQLVAAAGSMPAGASEDEYADVGELELPSLSAAWFLQDGASPECNLAFERVSLKGGRKGGGGGMGSTIGLGSLPMGMLGGGGPGFL